MIYDQIGHQIRALGQRAHVVPRTQPWINLGVIDWIEARIGAVRLPKEGQQMDAAEKSSKWSVRQ